MPLFQTRLTPTLLERHTRSGHWGTETFYHIPAQQAAAHPHREAIVDPRQRVTYGGLRARVDRTAAAFQHLGIGPGDVVTIDGYELKRRGAHGRRSLIRPLLSLETQAASSGRVDHGGTATDIVPPPRRFCQGSVQLPPYTMIQEDQP